jgi:hypothetical protein
MDLGQLIAKSVALIFMGAEPKETMGNTRVMSNE